MSLSSLLRSQASGGCGATRSCGGCLKERYQAAELPYPPEALREDILRIFADLTGELPAPGKHYYVERFAKTHVGMSTGWVSGDFWLDTAIPLLMERLEQANCLTDDGTEEVRR